MLLLWASGPELKSGKRLIFFALLFLLQLNKDDFWKEYDPTCAQKLSFSSVSVVTVLVLNSETSVSFI